MARPNINTERKEQILNAYERCIALYGVHGATLKAVADEAGIARPLVRHHVGNQDVLLTEAVKRFVIRSKEGFEQISPISITSDEYLLELLFNEIYSAEYEKDVLISTALVLAARSDKNIQTAMRQWLSDVENWFILQVKSLYPNADDGSVKVVSTGIIGIYFNISTLATLGDITEFRTNSKSASKILLSSLYKK